MGYDLHITRQKHWLDDDSGHHIPKETWDALVDSDPDLKAEQDGCVIWTKFSQNPQSLNRTCLHYDSGNIRAKNPDEVLIGKMLELAEKLGAQVQGDDSECYSISISGTIHYTFPGTTETAAIPRKPWWKLW